MNPIRLMAEIAKIIEEHGAWPGAFMTERPRYRNSNGHPLKQQIMLVGHSGL